MATGSRATRRRTILLAALAVALFAFAWIARQLTAADSFERDLSGIILSGAVTATTAFFAATVATRNALRQRGEHSTIADLEQASQRTARFTVGRFEVADVLVFAIANHQPPQIHFELPESLAGQRPDPDEWHQLRERLIPVYQSRSEANDVPFTDDPAVDMVSARRQVRPRAAADERVVWKFGFAPTTYYRWAAMCNSTEEELREHLESPEGLLGERRVFLGDLSELVARRIPAKVGTGTVVKTLDDVLVGLVRAKTFVAGEDGSGGRKIHIVGEGMLPTDARGGVIDPEAAAYRGIAEELGTDLGEVQISLTGFFFDVSRHQPVFCYLAEIGTTFARLQAEHLLARDRWETQELVRLGPGFDKDVRRLLLGRVSGLRMASNQAEMAVILALGRLYGFRQVRDILSGED